MNPSKLGNLRLGDKELFVHDESDLVDYDSFFEFVMGNGEMMGRVDALHSQHLRHGAKKDVICVRLVDLWGERTYPIHRGRPGGRFISKLEDRNRNMVDIKDLTTYDQKLDEKEGILYTSYSWKKGESSGENQSVGFMSKVRKHIMVHRYSDRVETEGWTRTFSVETVFPYHSRASVFYFKKPYNPKSWGWGEVEHENEIEPINNAKVKYDPVKNIGTITFSTEFPKLKTRVVWVLKPSPEPDSWEIDREKGSLTFKWNLASQKDNAATIVAAIMTDRDSPDYLAAATREAEGAFASRWEELRKEQIDWWRNELGKSLVSIPDERLQRLYDVSMHYLLNSVGGSYWGFIGVDNVIYETCMCDNMVMLHALVETNHLEAAQEELEALDKYLPAAKKNATERMKAVGITSRDAALLPFYMSEDGVELWQDNVFGMYASMSGFHALALLKTGHYKNDEGFLRKHAYPWLKGYAEYGRLGAVWDKRLNAYVYPIENVGGGGEGYWYLVTMSSKLYTRVFAESKSMFRFSDFAPLKFFPKEELSRLSSNWLDTVVDFKWITEQTAYYAEKFGVDTELSKEWRKVASNLHIPQNDQFFMSNTGTDAKPSIGSSATGTLFWPAEGTFEDLDREKVDRTFQEIIEQRHIEGLLRRRGRAWDAVFGFCYAYMNMGEEAYQCLKTFDRAADHRGIEMREGIDHQNHYYLLNHGSLVLLTRYMLLLTYENKIRVFPAIPRKWRSLGVSFANLPAEGSLAVSGKTDATLTEIDISDRKGKELVRLVGGAFPFEIVPKNLDIEKAEVEFDLKGTPAQIEVSLSNVQKGRKYLVKTDDKENVIKTDPDLRFTVSLPARVHIKPM